MRSAHCTLAIALAALTKLASNQCDAYQITTSPVLPMDPTEPHRVLQQWHEVGQDPLDNLINHEALQTLKISIPGRVFVSVNHDFGSTKPATGSAQAAIVRISGNSEDIFKYFDVVSSAPHEIEIRRRPTARGGLDEVFLLTEISLSQRHQLSQIISTGPADLVVEDGVFINDQQTPLKLELTGSGNVYVDTRSSKLASEVNVASYSSGNLYWIMDTVQTSSYKVAGAGSGDLNIIGASVDTTTTDISLAGSGDFCVDATTFKTQTLQIKTLGTGEASLSSDAGHCIREEIGVLGTGNILLGALQCKDVKIAVVGSGDVYVQATNSITGAKYGSGDVMYVGNRPTQISDRQSDHVFSTEQKKNYKPIAVPAHANRAMTCRAGTVPRREAVAVTSYQSMTGSVGLGPLILFALLSLCYLRCQRKPRRARAPRYAGYTHAAELQPFVTSSMPPLANTRQPQPQQQQSQVYV